MQILEERLAVLEGSEDAAAFVSGMSAISTVMLAFLKPGDLLLISNPTYGGTHTFVNNYLKEIGVHVISFDFDHNYDDILNKLKQSGYELYSDYFFDTVTVLTKDKTEQIFQNALLQKVNIRKVNSKMLAISFLKIVK